MRHETSAEADARRKTSIETGAQLATPDINGSRHKAPTEADTRTERCANTGARPALLSYPRRELAKPQRTGTS